MNSRGVDPQGAVIKNNAISTEATVTRKSPETELAKKIELGGQNPKPSNAIENAREAFSR